MAWNDNLSGTALEIAQSASQRVRVMAGPGTGKSFAMMRRIARLIEEDRIEPEEILAVTFTRTSANDLRDGLKSLGIHGADKVKAMTLHALCFGLLNRKEVFHILNRIPRPLKTFTKNGSPQFELNPFLKDLDLVGDFGNKRNKFELIKAFEAAWARKQTDNTQITNQRDRAFEEAMKGWLHEHEAILVGELIPLTLKYLEDNPASDILKKYSHIVVDEYQDLNKAEQMLLDLLAKYGSLCVVGDEDQSIYQFRYANPDGISDFAWFYR